MKNLLPSLRFLLVLLVVGTCLPASRAVAQTGRRNFYRVYQFDSPYKGWVEGTLWTTIVPVSHADYEHFGETLPRQGLLANSFEVEYGITDKLALGLYGDAEDANGGGLRFTQSRFVLRYQAGVRYQSFFNTSLYFEYDAPRRSYGGQELEARVILTHDFNDIRLAINPVLTKAVTGEESRLWPSVLLDVGAYYRKSFPLQPGVELYGDFGETGKFSTQRFLVFPTVDIRFGRFTWNLGAGLPLTANADRLTFKSLFIYQFGAVRPERLFHRGQRPTTPAPATTVQP